MHFNDILAFQFIPITELGATNFELNSLCFKMTTMTIQVKVVKLPYRIFFGCFVG